MAPLRALADILQIPARGNVAFVPCIDQFVPDKTMVYRAWPDAICVEALRASGGRTSNGAAFPSSPACSPPSSRYWPASVGCSSTSSSEEHARPQDDDRHQGNCPDTDHIVHLACFGTVSGMANVRNGFLYRPLRCLRVDFAGTAGYERMTDHGFRQWTRRIIFTVSVVYLFRGAVLWWHHG